MSIIPLLILIVGTILVILNAPKHAKKSSKFVFDEDQKMKDGVKTDEIGKHKCGHKSLQEGIEAGCIFCAAEFQARLR